MLAHDLGHTPFGHAGERVLAGLMKGEGGFDHNRQSLRIVDWLEDRYPGFPRPQPHQRDARGPAQARLALGAPGARCPSPRRSRASRRRWPTPPTRSPTPITTSTTAWARGCSRRRGSKRSTLWRETLRAVREQLGDVPERVLHAQVVVALINRLVTDLIEAVAERVDARRLRLGRRRARLPRAPRALLARAREAEARAQEVPLRRALSAPAGARDERARGGDPRRSLRRLPERSGAAARARARAHPAAMARPARSPTTSRA